MNFFVADDQPLRRGEVLSAFRSALSSILGRTVKTEDARFLDSQLADFMAWDSDGRVYAIRWVDGREIAAKLFSLLSQYSRLSEAGGPALERALRTGDVHPDGAVELVLVGHRFSDRFVDVLKTLSIPVRLVSVHSVHSGESAEKALYFETRFSNTESQASPEHTPESFSRPDFDVPAASVPIEQAPVFSHPPPSPSPVQPLPLEGQRLGGAEVVQTQSAKVSSVRPLAEDSDEYDDLMAPPSNGDIEPDAFGALSPEESTHFRLLEAALRPRPE